MAKPFFFFPGHKKIDKFSALWPEKEKKGIKHLARLLLA